MSTTKAPAWSDLRKMVEWKVDPQLIVGGLVATLNATPWLNSTCPTCKAGPGALCMTGPGLTSKRPHRTRR